MKNKLMAIPAILFGGLAAFTSMASPLLAQISAQYLKPGQSAAHVGTPVSFCIFPESKQSSKVTFNGKPLVTVQPGRSQTCYNVTQKNQRITLYNVGPGAVSVSFKPVGK